MAEKNNKSFGAGAGDMPAQQKAAGQRSQRPQPRHRAVENLAFVVFKNAVYKGPILFGNYNDIRLLENKERKAAGLPKLPARRYSSTKIAALASMEPAMVLAPPKAESEQP